VVQEDDFLARVALVVLVDGVDQRAGHRRAIALGDVAHALVQRRLEGVQALGRAELVVDADHLELHPRRVVRAELLGEELEALELVRTDRRHQARERVDPGDLDGFALLGVGGAEGQDEGSGGDRLVGELHVVSPR
jgi:hypothetical protein